ncbi:hypothetical protein Poli38472_005684 [Pythium oligandrum]|uniref:Uncharacterized protein n=1 Tax=Pythium oligandrum TaxID=41045 RepID=A0A8K1CGG2_PYTOL|nr:hypothetical protein Poli38472_005684 [Pythium oligandrum]|eukprot:TMW63066.1 hypothetical protein Poli38472_005684 [Pythium oligandrum]
MARDASSARPPLPRRRPAQDAGVADGEGVRVSAPPKTQALAAFARCVEAELRELVEVFVGIENVSFAEFKRLWAELRVGALFHVEFRDSTPTDTHRIILQQALALVVDAVALDHDQDDDIAQVLGFGFALYAAFSVQLSEPRHKIAVTPTSWQALVELSTLATQALGHVDEAIARAAAEMLAMLRQMQADDGFLRCLSGEVGEYNVVIQRKGTVASRVGLQQTIPSRVASTEADYALDDTLARLEALNTQYVARMEALTAAQTGPQHTVNAARANSSRGRAAPSFLRSTRRAETTANSARLGSLTTVWTEERSTASSSWLKRLRSAFEPPQAPAIDHSQDRSDSFSVLNSSDGASSDVDAALLALEAELERDVVPSAPSPEVVPVAVPTPRRLPIANRSTFRRGSMSIASSGQESDGLAELEEELAMEVGQRGQALAPAQPSTAVLPAAPRRSVRPRALSVAESARSSVFDSGDELLELQRELEAAVAEPRSVPIREPPKTTQPTRKRAAPTQRAKAPAKRATPVVAVPQPQPKAVEPPRRSRRLSIVSSAATESDAELAELQTELLRDTVVPLATGTSIGLPSAPLRRLRGPSISSVATESDAELNELLFELNTTVAARPPPAKPRRQATAKPKTTKPKATAPAKRQVREKSTKPRETKPRAPAKKKAAPTTTRMPTAKRSTVPMASTAPPESRPIAPPASRLPSSRRSIVSSYDGESDGLAELEMELNASIS